MLNTLNFDDLGHLTPYGLIETDWAAFIDTFGWNDHRRLLIESLYSFLMKLNDLSINTFILWIDGSFITQKEQPNDLDVVFVLPAMVHQRFERDLRTLRDQFDKLDVYFVRMIDAAEADYFLYVSDRAEWLFQFTMTRPDRFTQRKFPKGFIQITCSDESAFQRI